MVKGYSDDIRMEFKMSKCVVLSVLRVRGLRRLGWNCQVGK